MPRFYLPSTGAGDWQRLLGDPVKHWRSGYSARTLAHCWEEAAGLPPEISRMLEALGENPRLLLAIPEHKVPLPGATVGDSQNDLFVLARTDSNTFALTIEGKVNEPFDQPLGKWLVNASPGKRMRLDALCNELGLQQPLPEDLHYQLLHRTVSAIIEARSFKADIAVMIVHSFSPERLWFDAFAKFAALFDIAAEANRLLAIRPNNSPPLYIGWASGDLRFLKY